MNKLGAVVLSGVLLGGLGVELSAAAPTVNVTPRFEVAPDSLTLARHRRRYYSSYYPRSYYRPYGYSSYYYSPRYYSRGYSSYYSPYYYGRGYRYYRPRSGISFSFGF